MHKKSIIYGGTELSKAKKALILIHGRGGSAEDILSLAPLLNIDEYAWIAPRATNNTWYPYSFLAPQSQNEPWLSSALEVLGETVADLVTAGIQKENIYFLGFSQGACLTLEFVTRNAARWGGVTAFTGGLIGDKLQPGNYKGDFGGTPVFIGTSDPDPHVPVERVYATANILKDLHAAVTEKVYYNMGHTITQDEIENAKRLVFQSTAGN